MDKGEKMQIEILKKISPKKRVKIGAELYDMCYKIIESSIKNENQKISEIELRKKIAERII